MFEWRALGQQLDLENYFLEVIRYNCHDQVQVCRKEMIYHWIGTGTATLQKLIEALEVVGRIDVAEELKQLSNILILV